MLSVGEQVRSGVGSEDRKVVTGRQDGRPEVDEVADEVVVVCFGDAEAADLAGGEDAIAGIGDVADAVDFGGLGREAGLPEEVGF